MSRELDIQVAQALGWHKTEEFRKSRFGSGYSYWMDPNGDVACLPPYSTDIAVAWGLVEMLRQNHRLEIEVDKPDVVCTVFVVTLQGWTSILWKSAPTAAEAICLAFLGAREEA